MWDQVKAGKATFDPDDTLDTIKRAEAIPDAKYKEMLAPYAAERYSNSADANKFLNDAVDRKHNLRSDFEKLYSDVLNTKFKFDQPPTGEGIVDEIKQYSGNPAPLFKQSLPQYQEEMRAAASELLSKYNYKHGSSNSSTDFTAVHTWQEEIGLKNDNPDKDTLQATAKGLGVYPEMAAKFGLGPKDLFDVQNAMQHWSGSAKSMGAQHFRQAAQEIVQGKCCSDKFGQAVALERELTRAKLLQDPAWKAEGQNRLSRSLAGDVKQKIQAMAKKHPVVYVHLLNAEGWSDNEGYGKGVLWANVSVDHVISCYKTNKDAWGAHMIEHEHIVAIPGAWKQFQASDIGKG